MLVLMAIGLVVALGLGAAGAALYHGVRSGKLAEQAVDEYFTALEERRFEDAYLMLCPDTRSSHPRGALESTVDARPLTAHEMTGELRVNGMPQRTTGTVGVRITYADGTSDARLVALVRQDGAWLVCDTPY